jgi:hypothetical protein
MLYEHDVEFVAEPVSYAEPSSVEEANRWLAETGSRIAWIDAQLGDVLRKQEREPREYRAWRRRAIAAKTHLEDDRRALKLYLGGQHAEVQRQRRERHEAYMDKRATLAEKLRHERKQWPILDDAYDSVRILHEVFVAASLLVDDDSEENWTALEQAVAFARGYHGVDKEQPA